MLKPESKQAVSNFFAAAETEFNAFLKARSPEEYEAAAQLILDSQAKGGRLHVTGIGKCSHVSTYAASLFSSTGNPAYYLHGTEAVHGSCGQLAAGDVVIAISNSGETAELKATVLAVQNNGCKVIGISRSPDSWLARHADVHLTVRVDQEGGPMNRAPISSVLLENIVLQALSVRLQAHYGLTPQEYVRHHPGGTLGRLRPEEQEAGHG